MTVLDIDPPLAALDRLITIAQGDTGQSKKVANFLLAWWNAADCGGFDLTDLWGLDREIADDILSVIRLIVLRHNYPMACVRRSNACWQTGGPTSPQNPCLTLPDKPGQKIIQPPARAFFALRVQSR